MRGREANALLSGSATPLILDYLIEDPFNAVMIAGTLWPG